MAQVNKSHQNFYEYPLDLSDGFKGQMDAEDTFGNLRDSARYTKNQQSYRRIQSREGTRKFSEKVKMYPFE